MLLRPYPAQSPCLFSEFGPVTGVSNRLRSGLLGLRQALSRSDLMRTTAWLRVQFPVDVSIVRHMWGWRQRA